MSIIGSGKLDRDPVVIKSLGVLQEIVVRGSSLAAGVAQMTVAAVKTTYSFLALCFSLVTLGGFLGKCDNLSFKKIGLNFAMVGFFLAYSARLFVDALNPTCFFSRDVFQQQ